MRLLTNMLFLSIFISVFISLELDVISAEKNLNCEAVVMQECSDHSKGLLKGLESENQLLLDKECDALQASYTCLHVG